MLRFTKSSLLIRFGTLRILLKQLHLPFEIYIFVKTTAMQKIQVQAEVEVKSLLAQLDTDELEGVVREAAALLTQQFIQVEKSKKICYFRL